MQVLKKPALRRTIALLLAGLGALLLLLAPETWSGLLLLALGMLIELIGLALKHGDSQ